MTSQISSSQLPATTLAPPKAGDTDSSYISFARPEIGIAARTPSPQVSSTSPPAMKTPPLITSPALPKEKISSLPSLQLPAPRIPTATAAEDPASKLTLFSAPVIMPPLPCSKVIQTSNNDSPEKSLPVIGESQLTPTGEIPSRFNGDQAAAALQEIKKSSDPSSEGRTQNS